MLLLLACTTEPPAATKPATAEVLVVGIHGMGDSPERFDGLWEPPSGFRELHPRGTQAYGAGWRWFPARREGPGDEEIAQAAEHIAGLIEAEGQKAVVYGFSQGGALTMALTVQHPELVERGIAIGGWLPESLYAEAPEGAPPLLVLHGEADSIVPLAPTAKAVEELQALGWSVELQTWPGIEHQVTGTMAATLDDAITGG